MHKGESITPVITPFDLFQLLFQNGNLFYFLLEDWQFVNEFRHVIGKKCWCDRERISILSKAADTALEKLDLFHGMEVLFPEYLQSISRIFPYHGKHFHTMELDKTMEIGFPNLFLQYFHTVE